MQKIITARPGRLWRALVCALTALASATAVADVSPRVCFSTPAQAYLDTQTGIYYQSPPDGYDQYLDCAVFSVQGGQVADPPPVYYVSPPAVYHPPASVWLGGGDRDRNHDRHDKDRPAHDRSDRQRNERGDGAGQRERSSNR